MDRRQYLLMCRECAILEKKERGTLLDCPDELKVVWRGMEFYPLSLTIEFDKKGNAVNYCRMHDLMADSTAGAELWEIEPKVGRNED